MKLKESEAEEDLEEEAGDSDADEEAEAEGDAETDNVGDPSVEINVEDLIHELEVQGLDKRPLTEFAAKRRVEELLEQKRARRDLEDFEDYDV